MPSQRFIDELNAQIGREFAASQQYIAIGVSYDRQTLPRLAAFFYDQAKEERTHALMMVRYLIDVGAEPVVPGMDAPAMRFSSFVEPIERALEQEKEVGTQISELVGTAREERDYLSEQFVQWFLKEQIEEVALMSSLLEVARRSAGQPFFVEEFLARETLQPAKSDSTAPLAAGD